MQAEAGAHGRSRSLSSQRTQGWETGMDPLDFPSRLFPLGGKVDMDSPGLWSAESSFPGSVAVGREAESLCCVGSCRIATKEQSAVWRTESMTSGQRGWARWVLGALGTTL